MMALADHSCSLNGLNAAAEGANFDIGVDFHWNAENTLLPKDLNMPPLLDSLSPLGFSLQFLPTFTDTWSKIKSRTEI